MIGIIEAMPTVLSRPLADSETVSAHRGRCFDATMVYCSVVIGDQICRIGTTQTQGMRRSVRQIDKARMDHFYKLAAIWKSTRGHSSKTVDLTMHRAYQEIIGMGVDAIPLLLQEMKLRPDHYGTGHLGRLRV